MPRRWRPRAPRGGSSAEGLYSLVEPQGMKVVATRSAMRTCSSGSQAACVDEKPLFCTAKVCVDELTMAPQAVRQDGAATMDRMLVPVSGYALSEQAEGTAATVHAKKTGEIELISAGPARRWTNTASTPAHYIVVTYR